MRRITSNSKKRFDGKTFYWYGGSSSRYGAETSAEKLRARGDLARVEKVTEPHIYVDKLVPASQRNAFYFIWRRKA